MHAGWELVLVDLRNHGKSAGLGHLRPPHNIQSAANDIANLIVSESWDWPDVVMGHSYGGKVALEFGESCAYGRYGSSAVPPKQVSCDFLFTKEITAYNLIMSKAYLNSKVVHRNLVISYSMVKASASWRNYLMIEKEGQAL